jgi:hypothetical protein
MLCRYLTFEKFMDMLIHNRLFFSKRSNFSDKFEFCPSLMLRSTNINSFDDMHKKLHLNNEAMKNINNEYILCMRDESDNNEMLLMWDMYTEKSPFAIKVTFNKLKLIQAINEFFTNKKCSINHQKCLYNNDDCNLKNNDIYFRKDINYSFENEYRFIITPPENISWGGKRGDIHKKIDESLDIKTRQAIEFLQVNKQNFSLNSIGGSLDYNNPNGCYMPLNFDLIDHIVITPYANPFSKTTITYLSKLFIFPEVINENGMGWSHENLKSQQFCYKIRNSQWEQNTKNLFQNAVSPYDFIEDAANG